MGRVPKKGFGVCGSSCLGLGDKDAEAALETGFLLGEGATGLKAFALGLGLNEEAFTFKRFAVLGETGGALLCDAALLSVADATNTADAEPLPGVGTESFLAPLKGGMAWMTM
jgi:hypothetical protein